MNKKWRIVLLVGLMLMFREFSYAALWESSDIPLPKDTKLAQPQQNIQMGNVERKNSIYKTSLTPEEVLNFYQEQMPKRGWAEEAGAGEGRQIPGMAGTQEIPHNVLNFIKGDNSLFVVVLKRSSKANYTVFVVNYGKKISLYGTQPAPAKKLDFMPVYPEAQVIFASDTIYDYSLPTDINTAVSFYKSNMHKYGWQPVEEMPVTESKFGTLDLQKAMDCPTCAKVEIPQDMQNLIMERMNKATKLKAELKYGKSNGERVNLEFEQVANVDYGPYGPTGPATNVKVKYEKK